MTNEDAIKILLEGLPDLRMRPEERLDAYNKYQIALYMAIKALKERPQGDLISREALKKKCAEVVKASNNSDFIPCPTWNKAMELIDNAPTVEPRIEYESSYASKQRAYKEGKYDGFMESPYGD